MPSAPPPSPPQKKKRKEKTWHPHLAKPPSPRGTWKFKVPQEPLRVSPIPGGNESTYSLNFFVFIGIVPNIFYSKKKKTVKWFCLFSPLSWPLQTITLKLQLYLERFWTFCIAAENILSVLFLFELLVIFIVYRSKFWLFWCHWIFILVLILIMCLVLVC